MAVPSTDARLQRIDRYREQVLAHPLARALDTEEVRLHLADLHPLRFPGEKYACRGPSPYIQPRGGFPLFQSQYELTTQLDRAGADFIPLTIDSYTRHNEYETASQLLQRSELEERDYLNGYPLVCHGYELTRELYREIEKPISLRHGTPDARLLVEIAIAAGITEIEGGGICYCLPYSEGFPLDRSLLYWQYVDRICAVYSTADRPIHRESFGPLTATLVPPALAITVQVIEALLAAEQGVASFAVSYGQTGSLTQDVATAMALRKLTREYLDSFGFDNVKTYLVYHQWMGQFPDRIHRAAALIACSALVAGIVGADKIVVKTIQEASGVPTAEINSEAVDTVGYVLRTFASAEGFTSPAIEQEAELLESESRCILQSIFDMPGDEFWESVYRAFQSGRLEIPFSPHADNANDLISLRDQYGSIRISDPGRVPLGDDNVRRERELLKAGKDRQRETYRQLLSDINLMT